MVSRLSTACRHLETIERRVRARLLLWIARGAMIDEGEGVALPDRELEALCEAIARARRAGR